MTKELLEAAPGKFSVDTRTLQPGDFYCALPGNCVHGEAFVEAAFEKGAAGALVSKNYRGKKREGLLYVDDVLGALQRAAKLKFENNRPRYVIAITGSLGKTTVKEWVASLLKKEFSVFKSPGNANSQIGLPLCLLNDFSNQDVAVLEMGMTHPGQIKNLIEIAPPDIALITSVSLVHAENFSSLDEIARAKGEIFLHPKTKIGFYPVSLQKYCFEGRCEKIPFSVQEFEVPEDFKVPHVLHNLSAAWTVATQVKSDLIPVFENLEFPERRMQMIKKKDVLFVNDAYNAAPESVIAALKAVSRLAAEGKRIAVLGEMRELGRFSEECHRSVGLEAISCVDHLICYGLACHPMVEAWSQLGKSSFLFSDLAQVVECLKKLAKPGDVVLLKGSNSTRMWTILDEFER